MNKHYRKQSSKMTTNYHITKNALEVRVPGTTDIDDCGTMDFHFDLHGSPTTNRQGHNTPQGMPVEGVEKTQGQLPLEKEEKRQISMEPSHIDNFDLHGFQTNRLDLNKPQDMSNKEIIKGLFFASFSTLGRHFQASFGSSVHNGIFLHSHILVSSE